MIELIIGRSGTLESAFDRLRMERFVGDYPGGTSQDEFDGRSRHLTIAVGDEAVAYGRLTFGPAAVFETWGHGQATLRMGTDVVDVGMCIVARRFEKMRLAELLYLEALLFARDLGARWAMGAVPPDALKQGSGAAELFARLRAVPFGTPTDFHPPPDSQAVRLQPICCDVDADAVHWESLRTEVDRHFTERGYRPVRQWVEKR